MMLGLVASAICFVLSRRPKHPVPWMYASFVVSSAAMASTSFHYSALILPPLLVAVNSVPYILLMPARSRRIVLTLSLGFALAPALLELAFGSMVQLTPEAIVISSRAVAFTAPATLVILLFAVAVTVVIGALAMCRARDEFDAAEARIYLRDWHLSQLVADAGPSASSIWRG